MTQDSNKATPQTQTTAHAETQSSQNPQPANRFPDEKGLNEIQYKILEIINTSVFSDSEIVKELLLWQHANTVYGFGDLQYFNYLKWLNDYYEILDSKYYLNPKGKASISK